VCPLSFTEAVDEVPAGRRTTGRLRRAIACAVGDACRSVAEAADSFGVSWPTAHATVIEAAHETRRGRPRWTYNVQTTRWVRTDAWDTGFVDLQPGAVGRGCWGRSRAARVRAWWTGCCSARPSFERRCSLWRSTRPRSMPRPWPRCLPTGRGCCPTRGWWWIIFTWSSSPTMPSRRCGGA